MKKYLFSLMLVSVLVPSFAFASFDVSLKYGSKGDAVVDLQDFLNDQSFYSGKSDGKFGLGTFRAVKAFQAANNLSADGYFGLASRAKASSILADILKPSNDAEVSEVGADISIVPGCTSTSGFSVTTGHPCAIASGLPAGCVSTVGFSTTTGTKCDGTTPVQDQINQVNTLLNQIVQNTNPVPPVPQPEPYRVPPPTPAPAPKDELKVFTTCNGGGLVNYYSSSKTVLYGMVVLLHTTLGKTLSQPIAVTTDDPDLPSSFQIVANDCLYIGIHEDGVIQKNGFGYVKPTATGTFNITFTSPEVETPAKVQFTITD